jgi:hypothetical protein
MEIVAYPTLVSVAVTLLLIGVTAEFPPSGPSEPPMTATDWTVQAVAYLDRPDAIEVRLLTPHGGRFLHLAPTNFPVRPGDTIRVELGHAYWTPLGDRPRGLQGRTGIVLELADGKDA